MTKEPGHHDITLPVAIQHDPYATKKTIWLHHFYMNLVQARPIYMPLTQRVSSTTHPSFTCTYMKELICLHFLDALKLLVSLVLFLLLAILVVAP